MIFQSEITKMKMTRTLSTLLLSFIVLSAISLCAQPAPSTAVQQLQNSQQNMEQSPLVGLRAGGSAPETYTNETSDTGVQHILRIIPKPTIWEVVADSRFFYTDNATLSQRTAGNPLTSAGVFINTVSAAYAPTPYRLGAGRFAPDAGYRAQWYNYEGGTLPGGKSASSLDFNAQTVFLGAKYLLPGNWDFFGEFDYTRIVQQPDYGIEFYHALVPSAGVQKLFQVNHNSLVAASLQTDYNFSWSPGYSLAGQYYTHSQDRWDGTFSLAYSWQPVPKVVVQPYYRLTYTRYQFDSAGNNTGRNDVLNSVGISVAYYFTPWLSLQTFDNYDAKSSGDNSVPGFNPGYRAFDLGFELTATIRF
jgi:hypothetical protein